MLGYNKCGIKDQLEKGQIIQKMLWQMSNYQKRMDKPILKVKIKSR